MKDKIFSKSKFPWILGSSALLIALCAAFFSVYGIATLFAGASLSAMIMASALEIGKLVGTTFLYRYWTKCRGLLKTYLVGAIVILMIITSMGIFGYLSAAYQKSSIEFGVTQEKIASIQDQKTYHKEKIEAAKKRIEDLTKIRDNQESRMSGVLTNEFLSRNPLQLKQLQQQTIDLITDTDKNIKEENQKIQTSIEDIQKVDEKVNELKLGSASKKDVQTFKFVADALHMSLDSVARWFILFIIFVFDPLAICLILAYNVAAYKKEDESVYDEPKDLPNKLDSVPTSIKDTQTPVIPVETPKVEIIEQPETKEKTEDELAEEARKNSMSTWFKQMFKI